MDVSNSMRAAFEGSNLSDAKSAIESICAALGYSLIGSCSCKDKPKPEYDDDKWRCKSKMECFHYGKTVPATGKEGIIFSLESFSGKMHPRYKNQMADSALREHREFNVPYFTTAVNLARKLNTYDELRSIDYHVYGDRWDGTEGVEINTSFECRRFLFFVETFGSNLHAPPFIKNVNAEQIMHALKSK